MEPISTAGIGVLVWEHAIKPIVKSIEKEYGDKTKNLLKTGLEKVFNTLPLEKQEAETIEAEIINADSETLLDREKFLKFIENSKQVGDVLIESNSRNKNIDIKVEKGIGYIGTMNGDISF